MAAQVDRYSVEAGVHFGALDRKGREAKVCARIGTSVRTWWESGL